jgi:hypothetical protein
MIDLWLQSGTAGIVLVPFVVLFAIAAGLVWLTHMSPLRPFFEGCIGIAGPFFASVAVLFGLFSAFLANDIQRRNSELNVAVFREADGVRTILRLAEAQGAIGHPIMAAAFAYAQAVLTKEWPAMGQADGAHEDLGALRVLTLAVLAPDIASNLSIAAQQALLDGLLEVRNARLARMTLASAAVDRMNWLAMLILGVLTQVAIAVVQLDRMRPQALALVVFTTAFAATVVMIGLAGRPISAERINAAPLRAALASAMP